MSATIGKLFVAALVADGKVSTLLEFGKPQVMFTPTELPVFEFVAAFAKQYGKIPDTATIEAHTDEEIPTAAEPAEYYHDLLQMRWIERELKKSMKVAADLLGATGKDALQALETLRGCVTGLVAHQQQHQLVDFRDAYDLIVPDYVSKYTAEADGGVMLGWPTVDEMTGGLVRGDLASFIGRIALGKTWQMLKGCHHGWKHQGACQLFVSMEMKTLPISQRLAAMEAHVPAIQVKNAALTTIGLGKLKGSLLEIKNAKSALWVVDGNFTATVDDVYALARQLKPDSIWIDGGYLLKHPTERDRFRRVAENADLIKQMLADLAPTVCSWQFARSGSKKAKKKGETADLDDIGYCVRGDQIITTDRGLVRIADLYKGHPTPVTVFDGGRMQSGKAVFRGMKPEVLVCFEDGTEVACSPEHRFWAHAGGDCFQWITAQDLKPGDAGLAHGNSTFAAPLVEAAAPSAGYLAMSSITLTPKLGELMGLLVGDGSTVNDNSWNLACAGSDPDLIQRVADSARDLWGYTVKKKPHNGCVYVQFHSKGIIEQLTALGQPRCTGPHKHAPAPVLASTADVRCAFLRGLFEADGTIGNNQLRLSTTSSRLAQDVQILLRSIGVVSYVTRKDKAVLQPGGYGAKWANFYVTIPKNAYAEFELKVGFASQRKRAILAAAKQCVYRPKRAYATRYDRGLTLLHVEKVVCTGREVEMFDIAEVAETSRFLVNGVVTHNTDAIGQVSSLVLGLYQPESIETTKSRDMKILKGRNGETGQFRTHWDFVGMNFDELVAEIIEELSFV